MSSKQLVHRFALHVLLWILVMTLPRNIFAITIVVMAVAQCGTIAKFIILHFERRRLMQEQRQAYKEGYQAYLDGKVREQNPYLIHPDSNLMTIGGWFAGWTFAEHDSVDK